MDEEKSLLHNAELPVDLLLTSVEASYSGITIADAQQPDMPLIFINHAFEQMTGYAVADVIGKNCRFLQGTDRDQPGLDLLRAAIREGKPCTVEIRNYRKDGTLFWNELRMSPVVDSTGVLTHFIGVQHDITRRKEAEILLNQTHDELAQKVNALEEAQKTLHKSEARLRSLVETQTAYVCRVGLDGTYTYYNQAFDDQYGWISDNFIGTSPLDTIIPEDHALTRATVEACLAAPSKPIQVTLRKPGIDGGVYWTLWEFTALQDRTGQLSEIQCIGFDVSEQKQAELALRSSEERLRTIVATAADGIVALDAEGFIQTANMALTALLGYTSDEIIGQNISLLLPDLKAIEDGEFEAHHQDGSSLAVEAKFSEMQINEQQMFTGIIRDITERQEYEKMREKFMRALKSSNRDLEDFAYIVAHDLKAPLRAIGSLASWLVTDYRDQIDNDGQEIVDLLVGRTQRMEGLIDGILRYSRVNQERTQFEVIDLGKVVTEVISFLAPPDRIEIHVDPTLPQINGDAVQMAQLFQNLLSNAIKFMDKPNGRIDVLCERTAKEVTIELRDNGPGIESQYFDKIFEIFETLQARDEFESTGIGLSIVKKIVNLHQGAIRVESAVGAGTSFFVTLPLQLLN